jgi:DNA-binding transcriptional regulator GbsR (MarR family)
MSSLKHIDLSAYQKKTKGQTLIEKHSVPVTPEMKDRISKMKSKLDVNKAIRDYLEQLLDLAEQN